MAHHVVPRILPLPHALAVFSRRVLFRQAATLLQRRILGAIAVFGRGIERGESELSHRARTAPGRCVESFYWRTQRCFCLPAAD